MSHTVHFPIIPSQPFFMASVLPECPLSGCMNWLPHVYTYTHKYKNQRFTYERIAVVFVFAFSWILVLTFKCTLHFDVRESIFKVK